MYRLVNSRPLYRYFFCVSNIAADIILLVHAIRVT